MDEYFESYVKAILEKDPAVKCRKEAEECYPGLRALMSHRASSALWKSGSQLRARQLSDECRTKTGIEIHPGAIIGKGVFIDHGMGIVIGETAIIEDDVTLFHGVTLGGRDGRTKDGRRHPIVKKGATLGAHSMILGPITIGTHAIVGASSLIIKDVSPYCTVINQRTQRIIRKPGRLT